MAVGTLPEIARNSAGRACSITQPSRDLVLANSCGASAHCDARRFIGHSECSKESLFVLRLLPAMGRFRCARLGTTR